MLIGPGDYKEAGTRAASGSTGAGAGVLVEKPGVHIRGMDRNGVVLDGTKPGTPRCSGSAADQNLGPLDAEGHPTGRNGLEVFKANGISLENLSACNFLTGSRGGGNELWFNGGDGSGKQELGSWRGAYLSATSTYFEGKEKPFASYGIFTSNTFGPGLYTQVYANNQGDAAFYIGACPDCNTTLDRGFFFRRRVPAHRGGIDRHGVPIQPAEQLPDRQSRRLARDVPTRQLDPAHCGAAEAGPVGSGVVIAGGRDDTVSGNRIYNNGAWGVLLVPYPDTEEPPPIANCNGGVGTTFNGKAACYFDDFGNEVASNTLTNNGFFGNQSDVDLAEISNLENPGNCWHGNVDTSGTVTSEPKNIQSPPHSVCGKPDAGEPLSSSLGTQVACDAQFFGPCPSTAVANYPRQTTVALQPLPAQTTMPNPCLGVPQNSWCPKNAKSPPPYPVPGQPVP